MAPRQKRMKLTDGKKDLYSQSEAYWNSIEPSVDGMLGGLAEVSNPDITESKKFLISIQAKTDLEFNRALDCGCGIGRITKFLLLPTFKTVDMVDVTQKFLDTTGEYLGAELNSRVGAKICAGLQNFSPAAGHYDVIWCQWVLGHLNAADLVAFLQRCKLGLRANGVVVVKENVANTDQDEFDPIDKSFTLARESLLKHFTSAGLKLIGEKKQIRFPAGLYQVRMFAAQ